MKKRSSWSADNIIDTSKGLRDLKHNPRFPRKMKLHKSHPRHRMIGQTHKNMSNASFPLLGYNISESGTNLLPNFQSADGDDLEDMKPWERLRNTFSSKVPVFPTEKTTQLDTLPAPGKFQILAELRSNSAKYNEEVAPVMPKQMSSTAIQVNMYHCKDCRRHLKYGKYFNKDEGSGNESSSETSGTYIPTCISCIRKRINSRISRIGDTDGEEDSSEISPKSEVECPNKDIQESRTQMKTDSEIECYPKVIPGVIKEALTDDEAEVTLEAKGKRTFFKIFKWLGGSTSPMSSIRFILIFIFCVSLVLWLLSVKLHGNLIYTIGTLFNIKDEEPIKEMPTFVQRCVNYFFSVIYLPKLSSLFVYFL